MLSCQTGTWCTFQYPLQGLKNLYKETEGKKSCVSFTSTAKWCFDQAGFRSHFSLGYPLRLCCMDAVNRKWKFLGALWSHQIEIQKLDLQHLPATQDYVQNAFGWKKYGEMLRFSSNLEYILCGSCAEVQILSLPQCVRITALSFQYRQEGRDRHIKHIFLFKTIFIILFLDEPINTELY